MAEISSYGVYLGDRLIPLSFLGDNRILYNPVGEPTIGIRPDTNAASVTLAFPGTNFGVFGQTNYLSDISGQINGGSSIANPAVTGSNGSASTTTKWTEATDGYTTSIKVGSATNFGTLPGTTTNINFGSSPFTIEGWFNRESGNTYFHLVFSYNNGCGFVAYSDSPFSYIRWVAQNSTAGETVTDFTTTVTNGQWYHWFMSRDASFWYGGLDGTIRSRTTLSGAVGTTTGFEMGARTSVGGGDTMLYQDFRVTKGVCRYSGTVGSSYTIPNSIVTKL